MKGLCKQGETMNIYELKLHESIMLKNGDLVIHRVAGGWLYTMPRLDCGQMNTVFVPFDNEFQQAIEQGVER